jgi:hypothetical protein
MHNRSHFKAALVGAAALLLSSVGASALTFQGVTFTMTTTGDGNLRLEITNALNATGDWTGIKFLEAFSLIPSSGTITGGTVTPGTWTAALGGLSNGMSSIGCDGSGTGICFSSSPVNPPSPPILPANPFALTNDVVLNISLVGTGITFTPTTHLKVDFWTSPAANCAANSAGTAWNCNSTGSLLSQDIAVTAVPGPIAGAGVPGLIAACGGLLALARRRRQKII